jgi:hypothetical protein
MNQLDRHQLCSPINIDKNRLPPVAAVVTYRLMHGLHRYAFIYGHIGHIFTPTSGKYVVLFA